MDYQILVIEDDKATSGFITSVLSRGKYSTYIANTGAKALKLIETFHFNLVLLDLMLPDIHGSEILIQIRQNYTQAELPVVIISSKNDEQRIFDTFELGASDFITKPINEVALRIIVKNLLQLQKTSAELKETTSDLESANKELAENRQSLLFSQFVIENMQDLVLWIKPDGKFKYVNKAACEKLDYSKEELLSADITLIDPVFKDDVWKVHFGELREKHTLTFESYFRKKSGELIPVEIHTNFFNYEGEDIACGIAHDISIRQAAFKKLSESEQKFTRITENARNIIYRMKLSDGKFEFINRASYDVFGYTPEECYNTPFLINKIIHPDFLDYLTQEWNELLCGRIRPEFEYQIINKSGEVRWLNQKNLLIKDENGNPTAIEGIVTDITARKNNEQALLESERKYRFITENISDVIWILDVTDKKFVYMSPSVEKLSGFSAEEVLAKPFDQVMTPEEIYRIESDMQMMIPRFEENPEEVQYFYSEHVQSRKDGTKVWTETLTHYQINPVNKHLEILGVTRNISKRKKAELKLQQSEERYREMFEFLPIAISISDLTGKVKQINKAAELILGMPAEEHSGRNIDGEEWVIYRSDGTLMPTEEYASVRALRENRLVEDVEMIFSRPSGEKIWLNVTALPLPKFDQIIIAYSDITKKKQQETLIKIHNEQLKELNATKDKFFSLIAHDLKSPFNSIIGFSELLTNHLNDYNPEKIIEFANLIRLSSRHAYELLKNLLEWARTQTGRIAYRPGKLYLKPLIEEVIESLQSNAFEKNIKVLPVITNNPIAEGDRYMIGSVLRNLISNAIKFTHKNGIIRIKTITLNDEIQVSIIDPGVGIKPEIIQKLFKISEQASTSGTNNEKGTGLGLIICKDFIDKHGGRIWVESQPGKGSVFHFTLPKI